MLGVVLASSWAKGDDVDFGSCKILSADSANDARCLMIHLPWTHDVLYFDCGPPNDYRVAKVCPPDIYKGHWHHWSFDVRNSISMGVCDKFSPCC